MTHGPPDGRDGHHSQTIDAFCWSRAVVLKGGYEYTGGYVKALQEVHEIFNMFKISTISKILRIFLFYQYSIKYKLIN